MMSNKQYFKNIRSEAEEKYSNAIGDTPNCGCGVVGSMTPCCNRCGTMYYVRCNSGNTIDVCASSQSAAQTIGQANCKGGAVASTRPRMKTGTRMRSATGDKGLNWSGAAINVVAVSALGAVIGALVSKKGKVQAAKVGGSIGFLLGFVGGFQVLKSSDSTKA